MSKRRGAQFGAVAHKPTKRSQESEAEQSRQSWRDWLRDRDETNADEWEREEDFDVA